MTKLTHQLPPVRVTAEEKELLQKLADQDNRTLSNYVRTILIRAASGLPMSDPPVEVEVEVEEVVLEDVATNTNPTTGWFTGGTPNDEPTY